MNPTLLKVLVAFTPACMLFSGAVVLFWKRRNGSPFYRWLEQDVSLWSSLRTSAKHSIYFHGCVGGWNIAPVIILICSVLFPVSRCFPWDISGLPCVCSVPQSY